MLLLDIIHECRNGTGQPLQQIGMFAFGMIRWIHLAVVSVETAPKLLWGSTVVVEDETYQFERDGDQFFVTLNDPTVRFEQRRRELVMMTGSHHMHVFWYESDFDHTPAQLPIVYLLDQKRW